MVTLLVPPASLAPSENIVTVRVAPLVDKVLCKEKDKKHQTPCITARHVYKLGEFHVSLHCFATLSDAFVYLEWRA